MKRIMKAGLTLATSFMSVLCFSETAIQGYGSFKVGVGNKDASFSRGIYGEDWGAKQESAFGLQFQSDINERTTATFQVLAEGDEVSDEFATEFNWAYFDYIASDAISVAVGRIVLPLFYYSDFINVGYAYTTVVPPRSVYRLSIYNSAEGVSVKTSNFVGDYFLTSNWFVTRWQGSENDYANTNGVQVALNGDSFSVFGTYSYVDNISFQIEALNQTASSLQTTYGLTDEQVSDLLIDEDYARFLGTGFNIDYQDIIVNFEVSQTIIEDSARLDETAWYLMGGYRIDNILPYVMYETTENDPDGKDFSSWGALEQVGQTVADRQEVSYSAYSLGFRWDFSQGMALKFQHTIYSDIIDIQNSFGSDGDEETFSESLVSIDAVF